MKRLFLLIVCLLIPCIAVGGCANTTFEFRQDISEIATMEIVRVTGFDLATKSYICETLYQVEDIEAFSDAFLALPNNHPFRPPHTVAYGDIGLYVVFENGLSQLVCPGEQITMDQNGTIGINYFSFDEEPYMVFMEQYIDAKIPETP